MIRDNKVCHVCGKKYTYCSSCAEFSALPKWMSLFHEENCKNVFEAIGPWVNRGDKALSKEKLKACDLSNKSSFNSAVQNRIAEIFDGENTVEEEMKIEEEVIEIETVLERQEALEEMVTDEEKTIEIEIEKDSDNFPVVKEYASIIPEEKNENDTKVDTPVIKRRKRN